MENKQSFKNPWYIIRAVTTVPIVAMALLTVIRIYRPEVFENVAEFTLSIIMLGALPLMAYPVQQLVPRLKEQGRAGQRKLAMYFAFAGYIILCALGAITRFGKGLWLIVLEYLLSSVIILVTNLLIKFKSSGHACGAAAAVILPIYFKLPIAAIAFAALDAPVWIASLKTQRHTISQLVAGSLSAAAGFGIGLLIIQI